MPNAGEALCACMHASCAHACARMHACIGYVHLRVRMCVHMCVSVGVCACIAAVLDANGMIICQM